MGFDSALSIMKSALSDAEWSYRNDCSNCAALHTPFDCFRLENKGLLHAASAYASTAGLATSVEVCFDAARNAGFIIACGVRCAVIRRYAYLTVTNSEANSSGCTDKLGARDHTWYQNMLRERTFRLHEPSVRSTCSMSTTIISVFRICAT